MKQFIPIKLKTVVDQLLHMVDAGVSPKLSRAFGFLSSIMLVFGIVSISNAEDNNRQPIQVVLGQQQSQRPDNNSCAGMLTNFQENWQKVQSYCSSTGVTSMGECPQRIRDCRENINNLVSRASETTAASSPNSIMGVATTALTSLVGEGAGQMLGALNDPASGIRGLADGCPRLAGRDYQQRKRDAQKDLRDAEKELAEEDKKIKEAQENLNKESTRIQKDLGKAQKEFEEKKLEIEEEAREGLRKIMQEQQQMNSEIRTKNSEIMAKRRELVQAMRQHAIEMTQYTDSVFQRKCMSDVRQLREQIYGKNANTGQTSGRFLSAGSSRANDLRAAYNTCLQTLDQQKAQKLEEVRLKQQAIEEDIKIREEDLTALNENLASLTQRTAELDSNKKTKTDTAQKDLINTVQTLQKELTDLQNATTNTLRQIAARKQAIQNRINVARVELAALGPEPSDAGGSSGSNTGPSFADAQAALGQAEFISSNYRATSACASSCSTGNTSPICTLGNPAGGVNVPSATGNGTANNGGEGGTTQAPAAAGESANRRRPAAAPTQPARR